jgi:hypothetical protein
MIHIGHSVIAGIGTETALVSASCSRCDSVDPRSFLYLHLQDLAVSGDSCTLVHGCCASWVIGMRGLFCHAVSCSGRRDWHQTLNSYTVAGGTEPTKDVAGVAAFRKVATAWCMLR